MFDINTINKRYFNIKIDNLTLDVEPPKIKVLKKITAIAKSKNEDAMDDLAIAIGMILSKNKSGYKVPEDVIDELDIDQMTEILTKFFEWLSNVKKDPN